MKFYKVVTITSIIRKLGCDSAQQRKTRALLISFVWICDATERSDRGQGISEPELSGDIVYRIRKIVVKSIFAEQFKKLINRYKRIRYNPYIMQQTACLVVNPITVDSYALHFNCTTVVRASDSTTASS